MGVLERAEVLLQAKNHDGSDIWVDESGNGHHALLGGTYGPSPADPLYLPYDGTQYLYLPGSASNSASTPDAAPLDIPGDMEVRVRCTASDLTPSSGTRLFEKQGVWNILLFPGSDVRWEWHDGVAFDSVTSSVTLASVGITDDQPFWLRITFDVDNGASDADITYYYSTDTTNDHASVSWTQLGTVQNAGQVESLRNTIDPLYVGISGAGNNETWAGKIYRAVYLNGINGTVVFDADFTDLAAVTEPFSSFTESSPNAATVTINRSASGAKSTVVDRDMFLMDSTNFELFEIVDSPSLDFALTDDLTVLFAGRLYDITNVEGYVVKKAGGGTEAGYAVWNFASGPHLTVADGTTSSTDGMATGVIGEAFVAVGTRDTIADQIEGYFDGVSAGSPVTDGNVATSENALGVFIGSFPGSAWMDGEVHAVAIWRERLSPDDIATAGDEINGVVDPNSLLPDAEVMAVQWAKANPALAAVTGGRIATRLPKEPTFPFLTVFRVSGGIDPSEAPIDQAQLQWDCFGSANGDAAPDYGAASLVARTLVAELRTASGGTGGHGTILGMDVLNGPRRVDEPRTGWARYIVDTLIMTRED